VTVKVFPVHVPDIGVTVYVAVCGELDEFTRVPVILARLAPAAPPVMPPVTAGAGHEYKVPAGTSPFVTLTGVAVNVTPLHVEAVIFVTAGLGLTVTVTVKVEPVQVAVAGVTV
jgi:hypothetical protein